MPTYNVEVKNCTLERRILDRGLVNIMGFN